MQHTALPVVSFSACLLLTLWLWQQQGELPNAVGEVEAVRIDVAVGSDGVLVPLPRGQWTLFDQVEANAVIARLDPARASGNGHADGRTSSAPWQIGCGCGADPA